MARSIERALSAQGQLRERPFCHLLLDGLKRETDGTLVLLAAACGEVRIRLQRGRPKKALLADEASDLMQALLPLCRLDQGSFSLYEDVDLLAGVTDGISGHVDPYRLLAASLESHVRDDVVESVLSRYSGCPLRLPPRSDISWLRLGPRDAALVELIRAAPSTPEDLIAHAPLPAARTRRLLYAMLATKMLVGFDQSSHDLQRGSPATGPMRAGRPPAGSSSTWQATTSLPPAVSSRVSAIDPAREAPATSAPPNATPTVAGRQRSSGRLPAWQTLASLRPTVISRVSSLDPKRTSQPATTVPSASPKPSIAAPQRPSGTLPAVTPAAAIPEEDIPARVQRVEELVRNGRHDEALSEVSALLRREPNRAQLHGLQGLVLYEKHSTSSSGLPRRVLDSLKRALWIDPEETNALYTRGLICKRGGDPSRALSYFKRVLEVDPDHIDALREFRLAKLRGIEEAEG